VNESFSSATDISAYVESGRPIACERAMYFDMGRGSGGGEPIQGGHVSLGVKSAAAEWCFAEMHTGR